MQLAMYTGFTFAQNIVTIVLQVEFNKAALSLSDSIPAEQKKAALNRLLKVCT